MQPREKEFEKLIRENENLIHKVCSMYAFTLQDREDLFQNIVMQLWKALPGFKGLSKVSTWVYRISLNAAITHIKGDKKKAHINADQALLHFDIAEQHQVNELWEQVAAAVTLLNPIEKAIMVLYLDEYSYEEMEEVTGISQSTVRVKMNRIKEKLRQLTKNK